MLCFSSTLNPFLYNMLKIKYIWVIIYLDLDLSRFSQNSNRKEENKMNLNQIRILEACHKFLIGLTKFEEKLQNDSLVYRFQDKNIMFVTYQEYRNLSFIDFKLKYDYLDDSITYLDDREELISVFPSEHELRALNRMSDMEQTRELFY